MKKLINKPSDFVKDVCEGIECAYGDRLRFADTEKRVLLRATPAPKGKVGIVTAGGSGHLPVFLGYVGEGMLDGCTVGNVFASPSAQKMEDIIRACDFGAGVLCLYGNYGGDRMNFELACESVEFDNIETKQVRVTDDISSSPAETAGKRRGVAGMVFAFKVAGAAADRMLPLAEVAAAAEKALRNTRTMGVALSPCILPEVGKPSFTIADNEMEIGMGIHGEPGIQTSKVLTAEDTVCTLLEKMDTELCFADGDEVAVMVNGLGATPMEELFILYRSVHAWFAARGVKVFMPHVGEFATSMEMAGASLTVMKLDDELKAYLRAPAITPFYTSLNK